MFDPKIPYNKLPLLPPNYNFDDVELLKLVNKANIALSELNGSARLLPNRLLVLAPFAIREAVASSGIENINTTIYEAFQAELFPKKEVKTPQKEILYYRDALLKGFEILQEKGFLNTNSFVEIQSIIEPKKPGVRKITGTKIVNSATGEIIYSPPEGHSIILEKLKNYEDYYNNIESNEVDPLIKTALLHYQFEAIHPFLDGNGRTGRILMVLYICLTKRLDLPILFISGYILKNRNEYYRLLNKVTKGEDWKEWCKYILNGIIMQAEETTKTIIEIKKLMEKYKDLFKKEQSFLSSAEFLDYMFSNPFYTTKTIAKKLKVHRNTASKYFSVLKKKGIVKSIRHKNQKIYFNQELLDTLS